MFIRSHDNKMKPDIIRFMDSDDADPGCTLDDYCKCSECKLYNDKVKRGEIKEIEF